MNLKIISALFLLLVVNIHLSHARWRRHHGGRRENSGESREISRDRPHERQYDAAISNGRGVRRVYHRVNFVYRRPARRIRFRYGHRRYQMRGPSYGECRDLKKSAVCENNWSDRHWWRRNTVGACYRFVRWKQAMYRMLSLHGCYRSYCARSACEIGSGHISRLELRNGDTDQVFLSHDLCQGTCPAGETSQEYHFDCNFLGVKGSLKRMLCYLGGMFRGCHKVRVYRCTCDAQPPPIMPTELPTELPTVATETPARETAPPAPVTLTSVPKGIMEPETLPPEPLTNAPRQFNDIFAAQGIPRNETVQETITPRNKTVQAPSARNETVPTAPATNNTASIY